MGYLDSVDLTVFWSYSIHMNTSALTIMHTITARFIQGKLEPVEPLSLEEGQRVQITVVTVPQANVASAKAGFQETEGGWTSLLDCEAFEQAVYERRHRPRQPTSL